MRTFLKFQFTELAEWYHITVLNTREKIRMREKENLILMENNNIFKARFSDSHPLHIGRDGGQITRATRGSSLKPFLIPKKILFTFQTHHIAELRAESSKLNLITNTFLTRTKSHRRHSLISTDFTQHFARDVPLEAVRVQKPVCQPGRLELSIVDRIY